MIFKILGLVGITLILTSSFILIPLRDRIVNLNKYFGILVNCSACTGFWTGLIYGLYTKETIVNSILLGGSVSFIAYFSDSLILMINRVFTKE